MIKIIKPLNTTRRTLVAVLMMTAIVLPGSLFAQRNDDNARYSALLTRLESLKQEATLVEDILQIQRLGRSFGFYLDKGYFGEAADLFTDSGRVQYGMDGVYIGRDRIQELFTRHGGGSMNAGPGLPFGRLNLHMQLQPLVTVADDGRTASARWREWALLGNYKEQAQWGDAIQENDYIKEDGVWKISAMRFYTNFVAPYEGGWASLQPVFGNWQSDVARSFRPDQPAPGNYRPFPSVYTPPYHYANDRRAISAPGPIALRRRPNDVLGPLEANADAQELKLARLHSARAVENLQAMYGYYIDKGKWTEAASLFADDGVWEFGQRGQYIGRDSIRRGLALMGPEGLESGQLNNYPMLQPVIHVSEDNSRAWGRFRSDVMLARNGTGQWGGGVYENEYLNDNGTWRISKQHYWVTFWGDYDQGWTGAGIIPMAPASTTNPPDAPPSVVYQSFPNTYVVPFHYDHPVTGEPHNDMGRLTADQAAGRNVR